MGLMTRINLVENEILNCYFNDKTQTLITRMPICRQSCSTPQKMLEPRTLDSESPL